MINDNTQAAIDLVTTSDIEYIQDAIETNLEARPDISETGTVTEQVTDEAQMKGHNSSSEKKDKRIKKSSNTNSFDNMKGLVDTLNAKNAELSKRIQKRAANTPSVELGGEDISLEYSVQVQGNRYKDVLPLFHGKIAKYAGPLLDPLIRVINGGLNAADLRGLAALHVVDADGNPIKNKPLRDSKGEALFKTNSIDDLRYLWNEISNNEACMKALEAFYNACEALDFSKAPAETTMKNHRSEFEAGNSIQLTDGGYKELNEPLSVVELRRILKKESEGVKTPKKADKQLGD